MPNSKHLKNGDTGSMKSTLAAVAFVPGHKCMEKARINWLHEQNQIYVHSDRRLIASHFLAWQWQWHQQPARQ